MLNVKNMRLECGTCELGHPLKLPCVAQLAAYASTTNTLIMRAEAGPRAELSGEVAYLT